MMTGASANRAEAQSWRICKHDAIGTCGKYELK